MNRLWLKKGSVTQRIALYAVVAGILLAGTASLTGCGTEIGDHQTGQMDQGLNQTADNGVFKINGNLMTVLLAEEGVTLNLEWCQDDLIRTEYLMKDQTSEDTLVIGNVEWELLPYSYDIGKDKAVLKTQSMTVQVDLTARQIQYAKPDGTVFATEHMGKKVQEGAFRMTVGANDNFYGLHGFDAWENSEKGMLRNTGGIVKAGQQGNCGGPLLWSTAGYGFVIDSASGRMTLKAGELDYTHNTPGGKEYYVMTGDPMSMMSSVADLTGKAPLFPKWAMGFHHSEWGIDEAEMRATVAGYRSKGLPLDNYILDFDWKAWGEDQYGEFRWNETKFPNGKSGALAKDLAAEGVKMTGIMKPRIHVKTEQGQYAEANDFWWPKRMPSMDYFSKKMVNGLNFAKEEVRKWYFEHNQLMIDSGFVGYWNDEADEGYDAFQHMNMQRAMYEGQRSQSNMRVWSINRNFYLGAQRYAYGLWSGDVNSGFDAMKIQRERLLSAVNVGEAKWGMDTGGFNGDDPTPENYARWMQLSAFSPTFRVHGRENHQRQPWAFGQQAERVSKAAMDLRYSLIPYIYTYERIANETGIGIVRPLMMVYPDDPKTANYVEGWMFGDWLYVAPVVDEGQQTKAIYLPAGDWIDFKTGKAYTGNQTITYAVDSKTWMDIPLFVKSGAIIPMQTPQAYVGQKAVDRVLLQVYPNAKESRWTWYDDDGSTYDYEKGEFFKQTFSVVKSAEASTVTFKTEAPEGNYETESKVYAAHFKGTAAQKVTVNGMAVQLLKSKADASQAMAGYWSDGTETIVILPVGQTLTVVVE